LNRTTYQFIERFRLIKSDNDLSLYAIEMMRSSPLDNKVYLRIQKQLRRSGHAIELIFSYRNIGALSHELFKDIFSVNYKSYNYFYRYSIGVFLINDLELEWKSLLLPELISLMAMDGLDEKIFSINGFYEALLNDGGLSWIRHNDPARCFITAKLISKLFQNELFNVSASKAVHLEYYLLRHSKFSVVSFNAKVDERIAKLDLNTL
jgi:hypothetical protein